MKKRAWIDVIDENQATGELRDTYKVVQSGGVVDNILAVHSLHPQTLRDHFELYRTIMHKPSGLTRTEREIMAVVVSTINECHY